LHFNKDTKQSSDRCQNPEKKHKVSYHQP